MYSEQAKPIRELIRDELTASGNYGASVTRCRAILAEIETMTGARVISYFTSFKNQFGVLDDDAIFIADLLRTKNANKPLILILNSPGGQAVAAEKILMVCRSYADTYKTDFYALVPKSAKSAATILALGTDRILMSPAAELGPIDPQMLVVNQVEAGEETEVVGTKTTRKKLFQQNITVIPAIRLTKAVSTLLQRVERRFSFNKKIYAQFLGQYGYDLYLNAENELQLSKDILGKIVEQKKKQSELKKDFVEALNIFLEPSLTLSHNRPITLSDLSGSPLKRDGFISSYIEFYSSKGFDEKKLKNLDALLWEHYVRTNTLIEDGGNTTSKIIESSTHRIQLSADGQATLS